MSEEPTELPTEALTETPTDMPTEAPTDIPTETPTETPTDIPTEAPTETPTEEPTDIPTEAPTEPPTESPTLFYDSVLDKIDAAVEYSAERFKEFLTIRLKRELRKKHPSIIYEHNYKGLELSVGKILCILNETSIDMSMDNDVLKALFFSRFNKEDKITCFNNPNVIYKVLSTPTQMEDVLDTYILKNLTTNEIRILTNETSELNKWRHYIKEQDVEIDDDLFDDGYIDIDEEDHPVDDIEGDDDNGYADEEDTQSGDTGSEEEANTEPDTTTTEPEN